MTLFTPPYPLRPALALLALLAACAPSVPQETGPAPVNIAVYDPATQQIPLPNDLVLAQGAAALGLTGARAELITAFQKAGGFPNDQEVPITVSFSTQTIDAAGKVTTAPAALDLATVTSSTVAVIGIDTFTGSAHVETLDPSVAADYATTGASGTLTLHRSGRKPWAAGVNYSVAVRGGPNGVKVVGGGLVSPSVTTFLLEEGVDLSLPENEALLRQQLGTPSAALAAGAQLEQIRQALLLTFLTVSAKAFPASEIAVASTFQIAPATSAYVKTNAAAGEIPFPSDFLLSADGTHVANLPSAFCAAGQTQCPLADGLASLDGFSTTGLLTAATSGPILASTVTSDTVLLYKFTPTGLQLVPPATYETEPSAISQTPTGTSCAAQPTLPCLSTLVGLQPGAPALSKGAGAFGTLPLEEHTEYAVVITDGVKDLSGAGLSRSTLAKLLFFQSPLVSGGVSQVDGVPDGQARGLEQLRLALQPVAAKVAADKGISAAHIAMAYTVRTQSITAAAILLGATPYQPNATGTGDAFPAAPFCPPAPAPCLTSLTPVEAFTRYGIDSAVPSGNIAEVLETLVATYEPLDVNTGAFRLDAATCGQACVKVIPALIAVPKRTAVTTPCPAPASALGCAPMVVFRHGLGGSRGQMLLAADTFTAQGMIVVAIDAAKHGDRAYCKADSECASGACAPVGPPGTQGDTTNPPPPGTCAGGLKHVPEFCASGSTSATCTGYTGAAGNTVASSNYLVTANFFRTRDTLRQDIIDQSMLVRVLAPPAPVNGHVVQAHLAGEDLAVDAAHVYFIGQSLGAIQGTLDVATNPRISRAVLNVGGGTITDIFTNAKTFEKPVGDLLASLGIKTGTAAFLQFINVAKWVLDPADPINFAQHLVESPLPSPIIGGAVQPAKAVLGQRAQCDDTVPDPFNLLLYTAIGLGPRSATQSTTTVFTTDPSATSPLSCSAGAGAVTHGFLLTWGAVAGTPLSLTVQAQAQAASFLGAGTLPPPVVVP